jgi:hypothetical protein
MSEELKLYVKEAAQSRESFEIMHELVLSLAKDASKYKYITIEMISKM